MPDSLSFPPDGDFMTNRLIASLILCLLTMAGPAFSQVRDLPDFTVLVEKQGAAVVNIKVLIS